MTGTLQTGRLILRAPDMGDADAIFEALSDWDVTRMLARPPWPYARENAVEWIEALPGLTGGGDKFVFAVATRAAPERCIGMIGLEREAAQSDFVLGFWLARSQWGAGLMTEAAERILDFGFDELDIDRVRSGCLIDNPASLRVHEKLGFRRTGESMIFCAPRNSEVLHTDLMLTRADWRARGNPG